MPDELGDVVRITRRAFLVGAAAAAAVVAAKATGLDKTIGNATESLKPRLTVEEPESDPTAILEEKVRIFTNDLKLRRDPTKLDDYVDDGQGHQINQNLVYWTQVESLNGVDYHLQNEFYIENPEVVDGYNPDGTGKMDGKWIRLRAIRDLPLNGSPTERRESYLYINLSKETEASVQTSLAEKIYPVQKIEGQLVKTSDKTFSKSDIGKITYPAK